jgi:dTDP-4-dehydrorhamnose reductase
MTKKIGITGASSVVSQEIIELLSCKCEIVKFSQNENNFTRYSFDEDIDEKNFSNLDFLILCAWDNKNNSKSLEATQDLLQVCQKFKIIPIFISTFSVFKSSKSKYGFFKNAAEKSVIYSEGFVLRCGLIKTIKFGGVLGKLNKLLKLFPVCVHFEPDPCVYLTETKQIVQVIELILNDDSDQRVYNIAGVSPVRFSEVMHSMRYKFFHIKISTPIIVFLINLQEKLFKKPWLGADNLNGLICEIDKNWEGFEITEGR